MPGADERRRYERFTTELRGSIGPVGQRQAGCVVRDYCSGGLLVQMRAPAQGAPSIDFAQGQMLHLNTEFLTEQGAKPIRIKARVAWAQGDYLGLTFAKPSGVIVTALKRHDALRRAATPRNPHTSGASEARCLGKLRHIASGLLPAMMRELVVESTADLLDSTERATSNEELQQIYVDVTVLESLRERDTLSQAILTAALTPDTNEQAEQPQENELTLVETDEFERWLEASRVASVLDRQFAGPLYALGARLASVRGENTAAGLHVPFEPKHFTNPLNQVFRDLGLGAVARRVLYENLTRLLDSRLGDFYARLSDALDALGVPAADAARRQGRQPGAAATRGTAAGSPPATADSPATDQVADTVSVPRSVLENAVQVDKPSLLRLLKEEKQQRTRLANEMIGVFEQTPNMTESLAGWLQRLGEPLLREAAADRGFFQNDSHPLREIIDALGHLQMFRANPDVDPSQDPIYQKIEQLLQPIGQEDLDQSQLHEIAAQVGQMSMQQSRLYQRNVERVAEASEGRDRVRRARSVVRNELNRRYAGRQVPKVLPDVLDAGLRAMLELAWLSSRDDQDRYAQRLLLLDRLVAALGGEAFENHAQDINRRALLLKLEGELAGAAFDPVRRNEVVKSLREQLSEAALKAPLLIEMPTLGTGEDVKAADRVPPGVAAAAWGRTLKRCAGVAAGDRLRIRDANGDMTDLRVAWVRQDGELYTLVDHRGVRVRDISLADLGLGLHERRIEFEQSDGRPLSGRAVDAVLKRMEGQLAYQAAHDSLTGLINRQQFQGALEQAFARLDNEGHGASLLLIDIDQFRLVNDIHGYETGDRLLVAFARMLEKMPGEREIGHLSGDRFAALLPGADAESALRRAEQVCAAAAAMPFEWSGQSLALSSSVGVVELDANLSVSGLMHAAENALGAAKAGGGGRAYLYHADDPEISRRQESVKWVAQVDDALDKGRLKLRCQPIVPVRPGGGMRPHYEVLLGVRSGSDQALPIAEFIEAAERYNRMRAVDRWVTATVMDWIAAHHEHMPMLHGFAINLSGQTASDASFIGFVRDEFARTGIKPEWVSFEVTETAAISDLSRSAGIVHDLKSLGCHVALDDFGSGLASYSYLKELPVDWLKIDGVFVRKIASSADDYAVVKSINEIGQFLGKKTIAEYVADDEILRLVRKIGVDYAQGFGISPPILMDELVHSVQPAKTARAGQA